MAGDFSDFSAAAASVMEDALVKRMTPLPPAAWRRARRVLVGGAVALSLGVTGAVHHATPTTLLTVVEHPATPERSARHPAFAVELLHDITEMEPMVVLYVDPATTLPAVPALRGVYTGAAKTALESNGRVRVVWLEVTGYCPCEKCCGPSAVGVTASGKLVSYNGGVFVAADPEVLPFRTRVRVPGYHDSATAEVVDKGSAITGNRLDVFFPTHAQAEEWGRQWLPVTVEWE